MAKVYFEKLSLLVADLDLASEAAPSLEVKHFFSGAALYADKTICASWSPGGLAFKLPQDEVDTLISGGKAMPLRYFAKGHIKTGYAMFDNPEGSKASRWKEYFLKAMTEVL